MVFVIEPYKVLLIFQSHNTYKINTIIFLIREN